MTYISSQSLTTPTRQSVQQMQSGIAQALTEQSTGIDSDIGVSLGAHTGTAISLQSQVDQLKSYTTTNSLASTRLSTTSNTLTAMLSSAQGVATALTEATGVGSTSTVQTSAQNALQSLVGNLNTTSGGQYIFAGINTDTQPISSTATTDANTAATTAFQTYLSSIPTTASAITGPQMQTFLDGTFSGQFSDSSWSGATGTWSSASDTTIQTGISPSQSMNTSVSANDGSIRQVTQAYTMLSAFTGSNMSAAAVTAVVASAGKLMSSGIAGLNNLASGVGVAQSTVDTVNSQISSQVDVLKSNVSDLEGVDPVALSTKVNQLQTQLEASFELTAKLANLSLVNYLTS